MENANTKSSMGKMIAARRRELGLTQQELADKMGVTDKAVSKWERDLSLPDVSSLPHLAELLGASTDELLQAKAKAGRPAAQKAAALTSLICKAVALALGVAVTVLSLLGELETRSALAMLGLGLTAAGIALLNQK